MNWYVKEFSKLTKVSVRTLHHYDDIGLLKPSLRSSGNYRLYSEGDLLKLQTIVALKFFGFSLEQIKVLVKNGMGVAEQLRAQERCLNEQLQRQYQAIKAIRELAASAEAGELLEWAQVVASIEVYDMNKDMNPAWMNQVYSPDQVELWNEWGKQFSPEQKAAFEARWDDLIIRIKANVHQDPTSLIGQKFAKEWEDLVNEMYGNYTELRDAVWLAYKHNKIPDAPFDQALWDFIHKALIHRMGNKKPWYN